MTTSLARSIAHVRQSPVAVVVDASTQDESLIRQQNQIFIDFTTSLSQSNKCRLFQAVPTLEVELFPAPKDFEEMLSVKLTKPQKTQFKARPSAFVSNWIKEADIKGDPLNINPEKARRALSAWHLSDLVDFLKAREKAESVDAD
jgi:hypothetical protein